MMGADRSRRGSADRLFRRPPDPAGRPSAPGVPLLPARFLEPAGFEWSTFTASDGAILRAGHLPIAAPRGQCLVVGGFSECIEKYFETVRDLGARGFEVWCLDWRGQGGSERPARLSTRARPRRFERDAADLAHFAEPRAAARRPFLLIAHSMGGAIALLALRRYSPLFDGAILSAPMLGFSAGKVPIGVVRSITASARAAGLGLAFIPGKGRWRPENIPSPQSSRVSSDPERCRLQYAWFCARPELVLDGPTYGWLDAALRLVARLGKADFLAAIRVPILLGSPQADRFVSPEAHRRVAGLLPDCTLVDLPGAKHEPFLERDSIRDRWFAAIDRFIETRFSAAS